MFKTSIAINKKDYMACNMFYLKRYIGIKEVVLITLLLGAGIGLFFWTGNFLMLVMGGIALLLMLIAIGVFVYTSNAGYNMEFKKREATKWEIEFDDKGLKITTFERNGESKYQEERPYEKIEKVAILKDRVYIFASSAIMYYIKCDSFEQGNFIDFVDFIKIHIEASKFRMRFGKKTKQFPYSR